MLLFALVVETRFATKELVVLICGPAVTILFIAAIGLEGRISLA